MSLDNQMNNCFLLGIDYGSKKTGLAIGQSVTRNSRPLKVLYFNYICLLYTSDAADDS